MQAVVRQFVRGFLRFQVLLQFIQVITFKALYYVYRSIKVNQIIRQAGSHYIIIIN